MIEVKRHNDLTLYRHPNSERGVRVLNVIHVPEVGGFNHPILSDDNGNMIARERTRERVLYFTANDSVSEYDCVALSLPSNGSVKNRDYLSLINRASNGYNFVNFVVYNVFDRLFLGNITYILESKKRSRLNTALDVYVNEDELKVNTMLNFVYGVHNTHIMNNHDWLLGIDLTKYAKGFGYTLSELSIKAVDLGK